MQKMFSSTNNVISPFAHLLSSSYLPPMVSGDLDFNDVFVQPHDLLSASSVLPSNPQLTESLINMTLLNNAATATRSNQDGGGSGAGGGGLQAGECFFGGNLSFHHFPVKKPVKKDRHSKIQTAQGVRDRRVRLSINIARDFFDLQDMLGFDKASKTLEWLLRSSRMAIKELVNMKLGEVELVGKASKTMPPKNGVSKEIKMKSKVHILSKESRAKARARARERTKERMCTLTQLEASKISDDHSYGSSCRFKAEEPTGRENGIRESVMTKTKLKPFIALGSDQQSLTASMDVNGNNYFPNMSGNWDRNGAMPQLM